MAQTAIGKAALVLTTDAKPAKAGLAEFEQDTTSALKNIAAKASSAAGSAGGSGGILSSLLGGLSSAGGALAAAGPVGIAVAAAVGVGALIAGGIATGFNSAIERLDMLGSVTKKASTLGVDASQFQGISRQLEVVGVEGEQAGTILGKLGQKTAEAAAGGGDAAATLQRLGLDAKQLAALPLDQQFFRIADAIAKLPPGGQQAAAAMKLFEEEGLKLLPVLQKGGAGIQSFIEQQKKFGAVQSSENLQRAAQASQAWKQGVQAIGSAWEGLKNRAVMIAAPIVQFIGTAIDRGMRLAEPVFDWLGRALGRAADITSWVFSAFTDWLEEAVDWVGNLIAGVERFTGPWPTIEEVVTRVFRGIGTAAALFWDTIKVGGGVVAQVFGKVAEVIADLEQQVLNLAKRIPQEFKPDWLDGFIAADEKALANQRRWATEMQQWGANAVNSWGDSALQFNNWLDKQLDNMSRKQRRANAEVKKEAMAVSAVLKDTSNAALLKGSQGDISARVKAEFGGGAKDMLKAQQEANKQLGEINGGIKQLNAKPPVVLPEI